MMFPENGTCTNWNLLLNSPKRVRELQLTSDGIKKDDSIASYSRAIENVVIFCTVNGQYRKQNKSYQQANCKGAIIPTNSDRRGSSRSRNNSGFSDQSF